MIKIYIIFVYVVVVFLLYIIYKKSNYEGYSNLSQCINSKLFTNDFCIQTPITLGQSNMCRNKNGQIGKMYADKCVSDNYTSHYFTPPSW